MTYSALFAAGGVIAAVSLFGLATSTTVSQRILISMGAVSLMLIFIWTYLGSIGSPKPVELVYIQSHDLKVLAAVADEPAGVAYVMTEGGMTYIVPYTQPVGEAIQAMNESMLRHTGQDFSLHWTDGEPGIAAISRTMPAKS